VSTERVLASGFHERLHTWWPGLEEVSSPGVVQAFGPALITPPDASTDEPWWTLRDREEELVAIARRLKADKRTGDAVPLARTAVVFKRPLPYLYLAAEVFRAAGIPYQSSDALPLAAEPTAAAIDLVLETVAADFSRGTLVALLRSPHFTFGDGDADVTRESVSALDRALSQARYLGDLVRSRRCTRHLPRRASSRRWPRPSPRRRRSRGCWRSGRRIRVPSPMTTHTLLASDARGRRWSTC